MSFWRSRSKVRPSASVPENAIAIHRIAGRDIVHGAPFHDQAERKHQHHRHREEQRRRQELEAAHLDGEVLLHDDPRDAKERRSCRD